MIRLPADLERRIVRIERVLAALAHQAGLALDVDGMPVERESVPAPARRVTVLGDRHPRRAFVFGEES